MRRWACAGLYVHTVFYADGKGQQFYSVCWYLFRRRALCISVRETRTYSWFVFSFFFLPLSLWYSKNICKQIKPRRRYIAIVVRSLRQWKHNITAYFSSFTCMRIFLKNVATAFDPIIMVCGSGINGRRNSLNSIIDTLGNAICMLMQYL